MLTMSMWWLALTGQSSQRQQGSLTRGACDSSQPLAQESMGRAVSMLHRVKFYNGTSPMRGPPCQHPACKASTRAVTSGALPLATAAMHSHSKWVPHRFTCCAFTVL